jgi:hypothetical protein
MTAIAPPPSDPIDDLGAVEVAWSDEGCQLSLRGRLSSSLLAHARDLVFVHTRPLTQLTVRLERAVVTRELVRMLIATRRYLASAGTQFLVQDPDRTLPASAQHLTRPTPRSR